MASVPDWEDRDDDVPTDVEVPCEILDETLRAVLVKAGTVVCWIPKSLIHDQCENDAGETTSIFVEEWLALEKGFIS